jgi:hypothetical protein
VTEGTQPSSRRLEKTRKAEALVRLGAAVQAPVWPGDLEGWRDLLARARVVAGGRHHEVGRREVVGDRGHPAELAQVGKVGLVACG